MNAAIAGIGQTDYSKGSGRTELSLACEAVHEALADAGLVPGSVDAVVRYDWDNIDELTLATHMGFGNLRWMSQAGDGGPAGNGVILHAAAAIGAGLAETVVCYRSLNGRSGRRIGSGDAAGQAEVEGPAAYQVPWGMLAPVIQFGQFARRHMIVHGTTSEQFGAVAVAMRRHASMNPRAVMREPITLAQHQASRMVADPLRLLDCCIETDGACAVVLTSRDRARHGARLPVRVLAGAQASGRGGAGVVFREDLDHSEARHCAADLYSRAGLGPSDVDVVMVYDHFTPFVIVALESFGFCKPGEGGAFVEGGRIECDGELPVNTHGGNHSEAYLQGLSHVIEAVRQLRGEAASQVPGAEVALSCCATAGTASAVMLGRDA
jgi:acetyl-CoA acetyltransferase